MEFSNPNHDSALWTKVGQEVVNYEQKLTNLTTEFIAT